MIDVMLIDDDNAIRSYLRDIIEWNNLKIRLCCEAGDSETARELYLIHRPKIIITDINIPIISGLDLAKELIAIDRELRIIVITGFGDFENVRDSINIGAIDLLSKPIDPIEINTSLQKAVRGLIAMQRQHHTERALSTLLSENRNLLQERCIARLFARSPEGGESRIRKQLELLALNFPHRNFAVVMIYLDDDESGELGGAAFPAAFKKMCEAAFSAHDFHIFSLFSQDNRLDCLLNWSFEFGDEQLESVLSKLLEDTRFFFQCGFSAYIGSPVNRLMDIHHSAEQALLMHQFSNESTTNISNYKNAGKLSNMSNIQSHQIVSRLTELAQAFQKKDFFALLQTTCEKLDPDQLRELSLELLSQLASLCFQSGIYPWKSINYPDTIKQIFASKPLEIHGHLSIVCNQLFALLYQQHADNKNQLIQMAKGHISENIGNPDLSLDSVSSHIGLSKVYFCELFHKEEGISFSNYLNNERISKAREMLASTNKKVSEISTDVGYSNAKYFNYVFKRITGVTPLDYRKGIR